MKTRRALLSIVAATLALVFGLVAVPALAQTTVSATTSNSGNWNSPGTWNCSPIVSPCIPNNGPSDVFNVAINDRNGAPVELDSPSSITVNSLVLNTVDSNLSVLDGASLMVGGTFTNDGFLEVDAGSTAKANGFSNLSAGTLSGPFESGYQITGTFQYGGASSNTITDINFGVTVALIGANGGAALMTPDGTTNALSTLTTNNGTLVLANGAGVNATNTLPYLTGSTGTLYLGGSTLNVTGNYDQQNAYITGPGTVLAVGGTLTNDGGQWEVGAGSTIKANSFSNLSAGTLGASGAFNNSSYQIGGTLQYGGASSNVITTLDSGVSVELDGGAALMTPDGHTNALSTLTTNNGLLVLGNGASVGGALASLTGSGSLALYDETGVPGVIGSVLNVVGNYEQGQTTVGEGSALTVGGTFASRVNVFAGGTITAAKGLTNLSNAGELSGGTYVISGTFQYGGSNTIRTIDSGASVDLNAESDYPVNEAGAALMTPDGTTNALSTLTTNNGTLKLENGASIGGALASLTGSTGSLGLCSVPEFLCASAGPGGSGSALSVAGNYDQFNTELIGGGNALTVGGTFTSDGGTVEINAGSIITTAGRYSQSSGTTDVNGTLMSPNVNIDGGTLSGTGTVQGKVLITGGATISPGDPGTMTINGNFDLRSGSTLILEISGASDYDSLDIIGNGKFDGNVDLDFLDGFAPVSGDTFDFITDTGGRFSWNPRNISFLGILMPGTYTMNLAGGFSLTATSNWVPAPPPAPTPEPASLLLFGTGLLGLGWLLRRKAMTTEGQQ